MKDPYRLLGVGLALGGAIFTPIAYFLIASVPLAATGLSAITIGVTCVALSQARPYISPEASEVILRTGMENTAALLEELGLNTKAIYIPSSMRDGKPQALVPLSHEVAAKLLDGKISGRLIVRYGAGPQDMGIAVTTPGSINIATLPKRPGPVAVEIESAVSYVLIGLLDLASSVSIDLGEDRVTVVVNGAKLHYEDVWYYRCLGSPVASIVATIASEALERPLRITEESHHRGRSTIILEMLP